MKKTRHRADQSLVARSTEQCAVGRTIEELEAERRRLLGTLRVVLLNWIKVEADRTAPLKWLNVSDAELNGALAAAKLGGDPVAARTLIEYFYQRIHTGETYNERVLLEYLDHAFGKIIEDGQSADHAFGFKLRRGKYQRKDTTDRDIIATAYMILLIRKNWTWQDAKGAAANLLFPDGTGDKAVETAYAFYKDELLYVPDSTLMGMLCLRALRSYRAI